MATKLFNKKMMNKVFDAKFSGKLLVGIDYENEYIYLTNNFCILKASRKTIVNNLNPSSKIMGFISSAEVSLNGKSGVVLFELNDSGDRNDARMKLDTIKNMLNVKENVVDARYTGLRTFDTQNRKHTLCLVQYESKDGKYEYGAFEATMIDIFDDEVAIRNAEFYKNKLGPMKYVDVENEIEYLQLPIRFNEVENFEAYLK